MTHRKIESELCALKVRYIEEFRNELKKETEKCQFELVENQRCLRKSALFR